LPGDTKDHNPESGLPWYVLRVKHRHEKGVAQSLDAKGYEGFLPLYQGRKRVSASRTDVHLPLLPGYVFCRLNLANRLPVLIIPGVFHIVQAGKFFPAVEESEIQALQSIVSSGLYMLPWPFLKAGQMVFLEEGPLRGLTGILTAVNEKPKVVVSVTMLQRSVAVEIDRRWVRPIASPAEGHATKWRSRRAN
jgi:transcription antitermination factor NusG